MADNDEVQWEAMEFKAWEDGRPVLARFFGSQGSHESLIELSEEEAEALAELAVHVMLRQSGLLEALVGEDEA